MVLIPKYACWGVDNRAGHKKRILFLDIDTKDLDVLDKVCIRVTHHYNHYLALETEKGFHVVSFYPVTVNRWRNALNQFREYIDEEFYEYSIEHNYSVLRLSPKINITTLNEEIPTPELLTFYESSYYRCAVPHLLLYASIFKFRPQKALPQTDNYKLRIHFYKTVNLFD